MSFDDETAARFRETAFILGPFPVLSQTFIYREFEAMADFGLEVNLVSTGSRRAHDVQLSPALREMEQRAIFLSPDSARVVASMGAWLRSSRVRQTMRWMMGFPHRSPAKRARAVASVLVAAQLAPELRLRGIRYVHAHFAGFQTEIAMSLSRLLDIPYGCTWHAYGIYKDRNILEDKVRDARVLLTCTRHNVEHLRALCPNEAERIHLDYHGLDLSRFPEAAAFDETARPVILAVGRLIPKKGFSHLLRAASILKRSGQAFEIRLIGEGPERSQLEELVRELGLGEEVRLLGAQPNREVFRQVAASRVVVVPSVVTADGDMDGIPNVALEAMSLGRPVVGSQISGIPEVVISAETGFLTEPGDEAQLARQLGILLSDPDLAAELGARARALIFDRFDLRANVRRVIDHVAAAASKA